MNFSWPQRVARKSPRRGTARVWLVGATVVATAGAVAMAVPVMSAMASTHTAKHTSTTKMSGVSGYVGKELKLAAKVTGGSTPTGWVKFIYGGKKLCSAPLSKGAVSCDHAFGTVGSFRVEAYYEGNSTHKPSSSLATVKVLAWNTTTTVTTTSADPTAGKGVTITATVKSSSPATGTVTFSDAGGTLGTEKLVNGKASLTYTWKAAGTYKVTAAYKSNNSTHLGSKGTDSVVVAAAAPNPTTTVLNIPFPDTLPADTAAPMAVTVTDTVPGGPAPTGTVTVTTAGAYNVSLPAGEVYSCNATLAAAGMNGNGTAYSTGTCTIDDSNTGVPLGTGFIEIVANYPGDDDNAPSNTDAMENKIVNLLPTTTAVTPDTATAGEAVTLVATVGPGNILFGAGSDQIFNGTPDVVSFTENGVPIATCQDVALGGPVGANDPPNYADCTVTLTVGTYTIVANYSGDEYTTSSSGTETLTVAAGGGD